jgi:hypothetical protein
MAKPHDADKIWEVLDSAKENILNSRDDLTDKLKNAIFEDVVVKTLDTAKKLFTERDEPKYEEDDNELLPPGNVNVSIEQRLEYLGKLALGVIEELQIDEDGDKELQLEELGALLRTLPKYYAFEKRLRDV